MRLIERNRGRHWQRHEKLKRARADYDSLQPVWAIRAGDTRLFAELAEHVFFAAERLGMRDRDHIQVAAFENNRWRRGRRYDAVAKLAQQRTSHRRSAGGGGSRLFDQFLDIERHRLRQEKHPAFGIQRESLADL